MFNSPKISSQTEPKASRRDDDACGPFDVSYLPSRSGTYIINLNRQIEDVSQFEYAIQAMNMAGEDDEIEIRLQSPGGNMDATDAFIHAMIGCKAHIHTVATGNCSSAASAILLNSLSFELSEGFNSLIHSGSLGTGGAYNEFAASTQFYNKFMPDWVRRTYAGFLSTDEIEGLIKGQDVWLTANDWIDRHEQRNDWLAAKMEELQNPKPVKKARKPAAKKVSKPAVKAVDKAPQE
jgi:ATP-dependent protease ClpP protease subunit